MEIWPENKDYICLCRATVNFTSSRHDELHLTTFALDIDDYLEQTVEDVLSTESSPDEGVKASRDKKVCCC
jgi:hypothetical protein